MSIRLRLALACTVLLLLASCGTGASSQTSQADSAQAGSATTSPLRATTLDGSEFDFASISGRPTVLWFWAPWCTICRAEAPEIARVAAELRGSVTFIGVPGRGERAAMRQFVSAGGVSGLQHVVDDDGRIWSEYGVVGQPAFAFIDGAGKVEMVNGSLTADQLQTAARALAG